MNIKTRRAVAGVASLVFLALASIASGALAQTPGKTLKDQLVGHWRLVSVSLNGATPYGPDPAGSMFLDAGGHYSVIVITAGSARNIAYFGTYTIDDSENSITMHVDATAAGAEARPDVKRFVTFSGDELIVANNNQKGPGPGRSVELTWKQQN
jgi:Lipocalin-like domain